MSDFQSIFTEAGDKLHKALAEKKAGDDSIKDLKRSMKEKLENNDAYSELIKREKDLKQARKDLSNELSEIKKSKEQIVMDTDEYKEIEGFLEKSEESYVKTKDLVIGNLSHNLVDMGIVAEVSYKSGQLMLIVSRK